MEGAIKPQTKGKKMTRLGKTDRLVLERAAEEGSWSLAGVQGDLLIRSTRKLYKLELLESSTYLNEQGEIRYQYVITESGRKARR